MSEGGKVRGWKGGKGEALKVRGKHWDTEGMVKGVRECKGKINRQQEG